MDLNYLYHRRGLSRFLADNADCGRSRAVHERLERLYESWIERAKALARIRPAANRVSRGDPAAAL